jgi:hypothetical protein
VRALAQLPLFGAEVVDDAGLGVEHQRRARCRSYAG